MARVRIVPSKLKGEIKAPPSKSITHRAIICGGIADGVSNIDNVVFSEDIIATLNGMKSFGANDITKAYTHTNIRDNLTIKGNGKLEVIENTINCSESGSTLRFLIPLGALCDKEITYTGRGKLIERPLEQYYKIFNEQNIEYSNQNNKLPLIVKGRLNPGDFKLKGDISSQFITGLMLALPLLEGDSRILLTTELESKGYVDLTMDILKRFSIEIENNDYNEFYIKGNQKYQSNSIRVEGDFSQAAFWLVAGLLGKNIKCRDIHKDSLQGDKAILNIIKSMKGNINIKNDYIQTKESLTKGATVDASQCPDLVPVVAALGAVSRGTTTIINAERLRIKESDRLKAIATELNKLGADIKETKDGLRIEGKDRLNGGEVDSWNDHRIAMALGIISIKCSKEVIINNSDVVKKSYPHFWDDFQKLKGNIKYI
ncbi:MAG: 3-phosphoshikimate 1-carboxyvinyltransferase [Firmicutes bacterium]|nr:3-phosphoshikimate 1-carboxyvinyltransferase [Bacillota bacterium]